MNDKANNTGAFLVPLSIVAAGVMVSAAIFLATKGETESTDTVDTDTTVEVTEEETSYPMDGSFKYDESADWLMEDGKPVIALMSTTWCPHCTWVSDTYEKVVKEYAAEGKIKAYHFELDINDDTFTEEEGDEVPAELNALYQKYSGGSIPTFVFGGKYFRVGNAYESQDDLVAEEEEFRRMIDKIIEEAN